MKKAILVIGFLFSCVTYLYASSIYECYRCGIHVNASKKPKSGSCNKNRGNSHGWSLIAESGNNIKEKQPLQESDRVINKQNNNDTSLDNLLLHLAAEVLNDQKRALALLLAKSALEINPENSDALLLRILIYSFYINIDYPALKGIFAKEMLKDYNKLKLLEPEYAQVINMRDYEYRTYGKNNPTKLSVDEQKSKLMKETEDAVAQLNLILEELNKNSNK